MKRATRQERAHFLQEIEKKLSTKLTHKTKNVLFQNQPDLLDVHVRQYARRPDHEKVDLVSSVQYLEHPLDS
jgi:hypothetical protein